MKHKAQRTQHTPTLKWLVQEGLMLCLEAVWALRCAFLRAGFVLFLFRFLSAGACACVCVGATQA